MNFDKVGVGELTTHKILSLISEQRLWLHYSGINPQCPRSYKSPLRVDPVPSFSMHRGSNGKIQGKDHGGTFMGDIFDYIQFVHKITFKDALVKVNRDFNLGLSEIVQIGGYNAHSRPIECPSCLPIVRPLSIYQSDIRRSNWADIEYWLSYGITADTLTKYDVNCVNVLYYNGLCVYTYQPSDPCYRYMFFSGNSKYYRPWAPKYLKFRGNIDNSIDVQGYKQLNIKKGIYEGGTIVLTKSLKDVMLLSEYKIHAVAIHGEQHTFNNLFIEHLKRHYTKLYSLYDPDEAGMNGARVLYELYDIEPRFPIGAKDITDMYKEGRLKEVKELIKTLQ